MGVTDTVFGTPPQTSVQFAPGFKAPGFGMARSLADYLTGLIGQPGPEYQGQLDPGLSPTLANLGQMMQGYATSPAPYIMGQAAGTLGKFMNPSWGNAQTSLASPGPSFFGGANPGGRPGVMPGATPLPYSPGSMPGAPTNYGPPMPGGPQIPPGLAGALPGAMGGHSGPFPGMPSVFQSGPLQALLASLSGGGLQFQPGGPLMAPGSPVGGAKPLPGNKPGPQKPNNQKPNRGKPSGRKPAQASGSSGPGASGTKPGTKPGSSPSEGNTKPYYPNGQPPAPANPSQPFVPRRPFGGGGGIGGGRG